MRTVHNARARTISKELIERFILLAFSYFKRNTKTCFPIHTPSLHALFDAAIEETYKRLPESASNVAEFREKYVKESKRMETFYVEKIFVEKRNKEMLNDDVSFKLNHGYKFSPLEQITFDKANSEMHRETARLYRKV